MWPICGVFQLTARMNTFCIQQPINQYVICRSPIIERGRLLYAYAAISIFFAVP